MQRPVATPWIWADPHAEVPTYAVMKWKAGALYAGPADTALAFPKVLVDGSSMFMCSRAEALRLAVESKVEA